MSFIEIPKEDLEYERQRFLGWQRIQNKIQCFASKFALNNCLDDMTAIQREGVFCVTLSGHGSFWNPNSKYNWYFNIEIIQKEEMREARRHDYSISDNFYYAHLFFEIPVVRMFDDKQVIAWQDYCLRTLARQCLLNKKKAKQWLKIKKVNEDFDDD